MRAFYLLVPLLVCAFWAAPAPGGADGLPMPTVWRDGGSKPYSSSSFEQVLQQLKTERAALESEWKALVKRSATTNSPLHADRELQTQLKDLLERLQKVRSPAPVAPNALDLNGKKVEPLPAASGKTEEAPPPVKAEPAANPIEEPVDVLAEAHSLFRARRFEEALASFRQVDLKGKKAEARAPVQYLMGISLLHLGKPEEAMALFRDVANSRGDEKLAGYAQWQLELLRWQRDVQEKLQGQRERRLALEKKI